MSKATPIGRPSSTYAYRSTPYPSSMRLFPLLLLSALAFVAFSACGGDDDDADTATQASDTATTAPTADGENASFDSVTIPLEDPTVTPSGLKYVDVLVGDGASPTTGGEVSVHYTGTLIDGTKFDSSIDRGQPFNFVIGVGGVIKGWDEGVATMKVGGKRILEIPADLGYGDRGAGGVIGPGATLVFEVELLSVGP